MTTVRALLFSSLAACALTASAVAAQSAGDVTGAWKLAIGTTIVCPLTLAPDGTVALAADCAASAHVARWQLVAAKLELQTASGETVGILVNKDGSYAGKRVADGRTLLLSR